MDLKNFDLPRDLSVLPLFNDMGPDELQRLAQGCQTLRGSHSKPKCLTRSPRKRSPAPRVTEPVSADG